VVHSEIRAIAQRAGMNRESGKFDAIRAVRHRDAGRGPARRRR
jgi:hypothetical protein